MYPLHVACLGRMQDEQQLVELEEAAESLYGLLAYAAKAGPSCSEIVKLLLDKGAQPGCCISKELQSGGITPLHLLACWSHTQEHLLDKPASNAGSSRGSRKRSSQANQAAAAAAAAGNAPYQQGAEEQLLSVGYLLEAAGAAASKGVTSKEAATKLVGTRHAAAAAAAAECHPDGRPGWQRCQCEAS